MLRLRLAVLLATIPLLLHATHGLAEKAAADIPLAKCTPEAAIGNALLDALNRSDAFSPRISASLKETQAILDRYPDHKNDKQPVMNFLSPADTVRMTELLATSAQLNMYSFAEERVARDMQVMYEMLTLARDARDGKTDLIKRGLVTFQADEKGKARTGGMEEASVTYVLLLRHMFKDAADLTDPANSDRCNVDLALGQEGSRTFAAIKSMVDHDSEFAELMRIRDKYHVTEGQPLDITKMPPFEAKYATELQTTVQTKIERMRDYYIDLMNLRRLGAISVVRYQGTREDLLQAGGARDKGTIAAIEAMDQARYKAGSKEMQTMWNLWTRIDDENPTMQSRMRAALEGK